MVGVRHHGIAIDGNATSHTKKEGWRLVCALVVVILFLRSAVMLKKTKQKMRLKAGIELFLLKLN